MECAKFGNGNKWHFAKRSENRKLKRKNRRKEKRNDCNNDNIEVNEAIQMCASCQRREQQQKPAQRA